MSDDAAQRIDELCERHGLSAEQRSQLRSIVALLSRDPHAPTAVREADRSVDAHLADSLSALDLDLFEGGGSIVDVGAGAGFPGLPLAVALPGFRFALVDSQARKCAFARHAIASIGIDNAESIWTRVERWPDGIGRFDVALARALAAQPVVLEYAAPLLQLGGALVDWRGRRDAEEEQCGLRAAAELGMRRERVVRAEPFAAARDHHLHLFRKEAETPARFPRRVGVARKRPLG